MKTARLFLGGVLLLIAAVIGLCASPWYFSHTAAVIIALLKPLGLLLGAVLSGAIVYRLDRTDLQRTTWLIFAIGLALQVLGQSVLMFYQVFTAVQLAYPSLADVFFTHASSFLLLALILFNLMSYRSGLPMGRPLAFFWPALLVAVFGFPLWSFILVPVAESGGSAVVVYLNLFYPSISFAMLMPCAVMLRVGFMFRGGRLLLVWLPLTIGLSAALIGDICYAVLTSFPWDWSPSRALMDVLYTSSYYLVPSGLLFQLATLRGE